MKRKFGLLIGLLFALGVVFTTTLYAQDSETVKVDTSYADPLFVQNPFLYTHVYSDPWAKSKLMYQDYETFNHVWDYQRKQTREMCIGLGIGAVGVAGMIYTVNMPTPVKFTNSNVWDDDAAKKRRDRRIMGTASTIVGVVGGVIFARSFRWTRRIKAEVGLQSLRLEYNLTGNRRYFNNAGSHPKKLKTLNQHWKY